MFLTFLLFENEKWFEKNCVIYKAVYEAISLENVSEICWDSSDLLHLAEHLKYIMFYFLINKAHQIEGK